MDADRGTPAGQEALMRHNQRHSLVGWRGSAGTIEEQDLLSELEAERPGRVLVLMGHSGNRAHVVRHLEGVCDVVEPAGSRLASGSFDLAVTDIAGLKDWWSLLLDAKFQAEPTFLPVVLILSRADLKGRVRSFWDVIDEFVTSPVEPREFVERISMLLRTRKLALAQRNHLAYVVNHDRVTGLPNKNLFMNRINDALRDASVLNARLHLSVVHVPLSRVLKSFGNVGMDAVAARISSRLLATVGDDVSLARLTTEEWGLVHPPGATLPDVIAVLKEVQALADAPFEVDDEAVHLAPRVGVGVYPMDGTTATALLDRALAALDTARTPEPVFYSHEVQHLALRSIRTESRLHEALEADQFELWFQPQLDLASGRLAGVEALVRWRLPTGELVPPGQFLPVAEETGLIRRLDAWVLRHACRTMRTWLDAGIDVGRMCVNVCVEDLRDSEFVSMVHDALRSAELPPARLELELTETDLMDASSMHADKLAQLRNDGVRIAVDDFGTGYSSLAYLRRLPITTLKIDRSFIANLTANEKDAAITEAIVWLAHRLELETIAEGIEEEEQAKHLADLHVTTVQGFLYARPMPEEDLRTWLRARETRRPN